MTREQAISVIRASRLNKYEDVLIQHLLASARLVVQDEPTNSISEPTQSHFGGSPHLPAHASWPIWDRRELLEQKIELCERQLKESPLATVWLDMAEEAREELHKSIVPLAFLGQLSLSEVRAAVALPGWPAEGTLSFFYDYGQRAWGFDPHESGACRIILTSPGEPVISFATPQDLPLEAQFPCRRLSIQREWTLPACLEAESCHLSIAENEAYAELCGQLMPRVNDDDPIHRCGGYPQEIQGDMPLECQLVTNGVYCGDESEYQDPRRPLLEKGAADWRLLLQIDSDEARCGWMWGDVGRLYFWARQQDIEGSDFGRAWAILQCY